MKYLSDFQNVKIFNKKYVVSLTKNANAAKELLRRYKKQGLISQIKRDLYVANDLVNKMPIASKFEIGSNITATSCISYHSALEYHGWAHQIFYEMFISSKTRFHNFDFEGITYNCCSCLSDVGIETPRSSPLLKITDTERTIIDCINKIYLAGGLEEVVHCFSVITLVNELKLLHYLEVFNKTALYQKTGFFLEYFKKEMKLSNEFFDICKSKITNSITYFSEKQESDTYFKKWQMYAPKNVLSFLEQGSRIYV